MYVGTDDSPSLPELATSSTDEVRLAERLIRFDTSTADGVREAVGFLEGWLESRDIAFTTMHVLDDLPVVSAQVGNGPVTLVLHSHIDVVPGRREQFSPWHEGGRLYGRGSYDMKGATAAMLAVMSDLAATEPPLPIKVRMHIVPDEEADDERHEWGTARLVERGHVGDFVITGEPTDLHVGVQAKGVYDVRLEIAGVSAHSATPWLGTNAVLRAMDVYDQLTSLPFASERSEYFERASICLSRISAGDRMNKVPESCTMDVDIRFLPGQSVERIRQELATLGSCTARELAWRPPISVSPDNAFVQHLIGAIGATCGHDVTCVGRDGTNDGHHFISRGIPSIEFGPVGAGHHGPNEWVDIESIRCYRSALRRFVERVSADVDNLTGLTTPRLGPLNVDPDRIGTLREH